MPSTNRGAAFTLSGKRGACGKEFSTEVTDYYLDSPLTQQYFDSKMGSNSGDIEMIRIPWAYQVVSVLLVFSFSFASLAADGPSVPAAMLQPTGSVQVNGNGILSSTAVFIGDAVQTQNDSLADITAEGTSVLVMPNSSVKFQGNTVEVDQGEVVVATSRGVSTQADDLTITPAAAQKKSKYEVSQGDEFVTIAAQQGDVTVSDGQASSTVPEGQQTTQKKKKKKGAVAAGGGGAFPTKTVAIVAGAGGAALAGILIVTSGSSKKCVSPSTDKTCKCPQNQPGGNNCQ